MLALVYMLYMSQVISSSQRLYVVGTMIIAS